MRPWLYASAGIGAFSLGGLVINRPFGDPLLIMVGGLMGALVALIRRPTRVKRLPRGPGLDLCDECWRGDHISGIPCPNVNCLGGTCACARCNPHIGRYAPEDSPSYVRDYDGND